MKRISFVMIMLCLYSGLQSQNITQTIRGTVTDQLTELPIPGATVIILPSNPLLGTSTNMDGEFRFSDVALGRYTVTVKMMGYQDLSIPNVVVGSGKEIILQAKLTEHAHEIKTVEISASGANKTEALNELTSVSARQFSIEETKRYAGALNDPGRMVQSFAGVTFNSDGNNEIVVRGNSPRGVLWRMEGIEIPNPNHFSNQGASGGAISMLSNNMMANSDFLSGAFPADYGNASSGVFDMRLRKGNNEKRESAFQIGVIGTDVALEGPFANNYKGSYLVNYRYSSLSMLQKIGVKIVGDAIPVFQDLSFNINLPTNKFGTFTLFGIGGLSSINDVGIHKDLNYTERFKTNLGVGGITHSYIFNDKTWIKTVIARTHTGNNYIIRAFDSSGVFQYNYINENYANDALRTSITLNHKFNRRNSIRSGIIASNLRYSFKSVEYEEEGKNYITTIDRSGSTGMIQAYSAWQYRISDALTLNSGIHFTQFLLNGKQALEPRAGLRWNVKGNQFISAGIGLHSKLEDLTVYFGQRQLADGSIELPNKNLGFSKSAHYVVGYETMLSKNWHLKSEAYYQYLYDVPVNAEAKDALSLINLNEGFTTKRAINSGMGRNYGLEITLEKYFSNSWYMMLTTSIYDSKYKGSDNILRNTAYNGNLAGSFLAGKEFKIRDRNTLSINIRTLVAGGRRYTPYLLNESIEAGEGIQDLTNTYGAQGADYWRIDFGMSYTINRKKTARVWKIDIQNATNRLNEYSRYYSTETKKMEVATQTGIIPTLSYRIEF
jgi:hypothetical protein